MFTLLSMVSYTEHGFMVDVVPWKFKCACTTEGGNHKSMSKICISSSKMSTELLLKLAQMICAKQCVHSKHASTLTSSIATSEMSAYTVRSFASLPGGGF